MRCVPLYYLFFIGFTVTIIYCHNISSVSEVLEWTSEDMTSMDRLTVSALTGLSEIYQKRGRSMRNNELEWHRMYLYAITSQVKP